MRNKRIGRLNGKVILRDTPPYNDKNPRRNEIITTIEKIQKEKGSVWLKYNLYPIIVDTWESGGAIVTIGGIIKIIPYEIIFATSNNLNNNNAVKNITFKVTDHNIEIISVNGSYWINSSGGLFLTPNKDLSMYDEALVKYPEEMKYLSEVL